MIKSLSITCLIILLIILLIYVFNNDFFNDFLKNNYHDVQEEKIKEHLFQIKNLEKKIPLKPPSLTPSLTPSTQIINDNFIDEFEEINNLEELFDLYYRGVYSTYDIEGNLIPGVEPNPSMSINILKELFNLTGDYKYLFRLGQLVHRGMHKYPSNKKLAIDYFNYIVNNTDDEKIKNASFYEIIKINQEENQEQRIQPFFGQPDFNLDFGQQEFGLDFGQQVFERVETIDDNNILAKYGTTEEEQRRIINELKNYNDPQNTHDSGIIVTTKKFIKSLNEEKINQNQENKLNEMTKEKAYQEIYNKISEKPDCDKKRNALKSLDYMISNNTTNASLEANELELLKDVYIKLPQENFDILYENLSDMQEHGHTVCSTGRVTRIASTLNIIDPNVKIIPTYALKEEMLTKAAKIRETSGLEDEALKDEIRNTLKKEYLDTGLVSETTFLKETEWINYI